MVSIHVDDAYIVGTTDFLKEFIGKIRKDYQIGSEDWNDVLFVGQRVKWVDRGTSKARIEICSMHSKSSY